MLNHQTITQNIGHLLGINHDYLSGPTGNYKRRYAVDGSDCIGRKYIMDKIEANVSNTYYTKI